MADSSIVVDGEKRMIYFLERHIRGSYLKLFKSGKLREDEMSLDWIAKTHLDLLREKLTNGGYCASLTIGDKTTLIWFNKKTS